MRCGLIASVIVGFGASSLCGQTPPVSTTAPWVSATASLATLTTKPITQASADASAGEANINHDGTALPGRELPDISRGFGGIPRSAQPKLTAAQERILECTYRLPEANAEMPFTLFVPSSYDAKKPTPLVVDLHGLNITPLQQILFDGTADFAERHGFIVVAPMGYSVRGGWGGRAGEPVATAATKPGSDVKYSASELSEIDAMTVLKLIREKYNIDSDRIYLMGHSMGGGGTCYLGRKYKAIWAGIAPLAGAGGINASNAAQYKGLPVLIMQGAKDSIVSPDSARRAAKALQDVGAAHLYLEFPEADHEFWIRRGAPNMEKVFLFFGMLSKKTNKGPITEEMLATPRGGRSGTGRGARGAASPAGESK